MDFFNRSDYTFHTTKKFKKVPERGIKLYLFILGTYPTKILLLNLLMIAFSIPIVTMPAAITGASRVLMLLIRDGYIHLWRDFIKEFKLSFLKSLVVGLIYLIIIAALYIATRVYPNIIEDNFLAETMFGLSIAGMLLVNVAFSYAFPMIAMVDLKLFSILKNSIILLYRCMLNSFVLLILSVLFNYIAIYLFPGSLPVILTIVPALYQLAICVTVKIPFEKYVYAE